MSMYFGGTACVELQANGFVKLLRISKTKQKILNQYVTESILQANEGPQLNFHGK